MITRRQLDRLIAIVEREFPSSPERKFSITIGDHTHEGSALDEVIRESGEPDFVDTFSISDSVGDKSFSLDTEANLIKITAKGGHHTYPLGFCKEVQDILKGDTWQVRKVLPASMRRIIDWCLPIEALLALAGILTTALMTGWEVPVSIACGCVAVLLGTWMARRRFTTCLLLTNDAKVPWTREHKLAIATICVTVAVALIANGPKWFADDESRGAPKTGSSSGPSTPEAAHSRSHDATLSHEN
ncbi:hypothetical protein [Streptomyces phaeochromogenes]|uniref:hypothetical protein n=1 Tax=Streptomyces phaeochromogenes TaxID=1923 RepID=UPI00369A6A1C